MARLDQFMALQEKLNNMFMTMYQQIVSNGIVPKKK